MSYTTSEMNEIVFKAMGRAINKTVTIVELIFCSHRRVVGLHQTTSIGSTDITDTWEPLEEVLETTRHVSMITVTLSKDEMDTSAVGYQPPLPADQVKPSNDYDYEGEGSPIPRGRGRGSRGRGRGRGRGQGRGNGFMPPEYEDGGWDQNGGSGRGFRGRGRGGYGYSGPVDDDQQFAGGYNQGYLGEGGRGRGRGRGGRGRGGRGGRSKYHLFLIQQYLIQQSNTVVRSRNKGQGGYGVSYVVSGVNGVKNNRQKAFSEITVMPS
ncbi:hypothetical protein RND81_01G032700 [Saponaria officinalis]|uniref:DNA/RNA-binding protein Alba-like domain-containing protein n=1 Tax=Saponaria officinalis TaxID=3572 RepID=A0AAW1NBM0_SAPOF